MTGHDRSRRLAIALGNTEIDDWDVAVRMASDADA
jgi:hypothetical protein